MEFDFIELLSFRSGVPNLQFGSYKPPNCKFGTPENIYVKRLISFGGTENAQALGICKAELWERDDERDNERPAKPFI
jgi:hypothetical protein